MLHLSGKRRFRLHPSLAGVCCGLKLCARLLKGVREGRVIAALGLVVLRELCLHSLQQLLHIQQLQCPLIHRHKHQSQSLQHKFDVAECSPGLLHCHGLSWSRLTLGTTSDWCLSKTLCCCIAVKRHEMQEISWLRQGMRWAQAHIVQRPLQAVSGTIRGRVGEAALPRPLLQQPVANESIHGVAPQRISRHQAPRPQKCSTLGEDADVVQHPASPLQ